MGNTKEENFEISGLFFDAEYIQIFVKLKLFFFFYFKNINIEIDKFEQVYNALKSEIELDKIKLDPFNLNMFINFNKKIDSYLNSNDVIIIPLFYQNYLTFIIYARRKIKECINYVKKIAENAVEAKKLLLRNFKIKLSGILKSLYPAELSSDDITNEKTIVLKDIFRRNEEIIVNLKKSDILENVLRNFNNIIVHLINSIKELLVIAELHNLNKVNIKDLGAILEFALNSAVVKIKNRENIEKDSQVIIYTFVWTLKSIMRILENIVNEKNG